jgi:hypothetical protein
MGYDDPRRKKIKENVGKLLGAGENPFFRTSDHLTIG